jgi:hypothetical protein
VFQVLGLWVVPAVSTAIPSRASMLAEIEIIVALIDVIGAMIIAETEIEVMAGALVA